MKLTSQARQLLTSSRSSMLRAEQVLELLAESGLKLDEFLVGLVPLAQELAQPPVSKYRVGAAALGVSGSVYLGANLEFPSLPLNQTVHAEQAVVVNAANHGETGLLKLAVSAPPCGYCRQFLFELATAEKLKIIVSGKKAQKLTDFLPGAFGPKDLDRPGGMLNAACPDLQPVVAKRSPSELETRTLQAARTSYAPYTGAYSAVGLQTDAGELFTGPYLENAAYNPSLSPAQAALVALSLAGHSTAAINKATIVQTESAVIDHARATKQLLQAIAPQATIRKILVR